MTRKSCPVEMRNAVLKAMLHKAIFLATCNATMMNKRSFKLQRGCHLFATFFATCNVSNNKQDGRRAKSPTSCDCTTRTSNAIVGKDQFGKTMACQKGRERMFSSGKKIDEPLISGAKILYGLLISRSHAES